MARLPNEARPHAPPTTVTAAAQQLSPFPSAPDNPARRPPALPTVAGIADGDGDEEDVDQSMEEEAYGEAASTTLVEAVNSHNTIINSLIEQQQHMLREIEAERARLRAAGMLPPAAFDEPSRCVHAGMVA